MLDKEGKDFPPVYGNEALSVEGVLVRTTAACPFTLTGRVAATAAADRSASPQCGSARVLKTPSEINLQGPIISPSCLLMQKETGGDDSLPS